MANPFAKSEARAKAQVKPHEPIQETTAPDLLAGITDEKPKGKTYSVYLDDDVVEALDRVAKQNKSSRSKVLNILLRNFFLEK